MDFLVFVARAITLILNDRLLIMDLAEFLVWAKRNTYGSSTTTPKKRPDGSKEYFLSKQQYIYRDRYFGGNPFIGEEVVFMNKQAIWSMNYYGKATHRNPDEVFSFLVKVLGQVEEEYPYRGPQEYREDPWNYHVTCEGEINSFWGFEEISYSEEQVYWLKFHGGEIGT